EWFFAPQWNALGHRIAPAGVAAFVAWSAAGLALSAALRSERMRRLLTKIGIEKKLVALATASLSLIAFLACFLAGLETGGVPIAWDAKIPGMGLSVLVLFRLLALLAFVFWLSSSLKRFFFRRFLSESGIDRALQHTIAQIIGYVTLIVGAAIALQNAGIDLSALALFAGAVGVGLGFGMQDIARNFVSGIIILIERPIQIGDRIEVDKVAGQVSKIRARSTTVLTNDNIAMIVPNSKFIEQTVTNWSHKDPKVRFRIPIGVAYGSDVEKVRELLLAVAHEHPQALAVPAPTVFFSAFGESSLDFELAVWSEEMSWRPRRFRSDLNFLIERKLREAGIVIPFPQRDVHLSGAPLPNPPAGPEVPNG
ncbi:MAG: mechanosensitive ion channel domain-containing protein, partial [Chthoniobacteraceae bacterium]